MNHTRIARQRYVHAGILQPFAIGLAFIAQGIILGCYYQGRGKIAEIFGAIAVIISRIYLGMQVNDASIAVQSWYQEVGSERD